MWCQLVTALRAYDVRREEGRKMTRWGNKRLGVSLRESVAMTMGPRKKRKKTYLNVER